MNTSIALVQPGGRLLLPWRRRFSAHTAVNVGSHRADADVLPVGFRAGLRLDDLGRDLHALLNDQDAGIVLVDASLVGAGRDGHEVVGEALDTVRDDRVRTDHHAHVGPLQERVQVISAEVDDVVLLLRITNIVLLEAVLLFLLMRVRPEEVDHSLVVVSRVSAELDLYRSLDALNAFDVLHGRPDTTMAHEDLAVLAADSCKRQVLEALIDLSKARVRIVDVLAESTGALCTEATVAIHILVLVVTSQENNLLGVLELESHEEADDLERVLALVDIVAKEDVVVRMDVTVFSGHLPDVEEPHKVDILAVDVTEDLHGRSQVLDNDWLSGQNLRALVGELDDVLPLARELGVDLDLLTFLGFQQWLEEHLAQGIIRVLIDLGVQSLVRVQLLRLLSELIDRDLTHNQREVLRLMLTNILVLAALGSNDGMSTQLESPIHGIDVLLVLLDEFLLVLLSIFRLLGRLDLQ